MTLAALFVLAAWVEFRPVSVTLGSVEQDTLAIESFGYEESAAMLPTTPRVIRFTITFDPPPAFPGYSAPVVSYREERWTGS